ncbi:MAG: hypothetical protein RL418_200 [Actinomycetota bacterium]
MIAQAKAKGLKLAIAESLTGGMVCSALIATAGASEVVLGGIVAYQDELKSQLLGVDSHLIANQSAVDSEVAAQMANGVRLKLAQKTGVDLGDVIGIATTGVAGPDPVGPHLAGKVFIAVSSHLGTKVFQEQFSGDRQQVRQQATARAIEVLGEEIALG